VLYRKYGTTVYRFSWHMLGSKEDAEDATQATFLSVHSAIAGGTAVREPQAWVLKIARNECLARITQRMRRPLMDSIDDDATAQVAVAGPSVAQAVETRSDLDAASSALGRLPTSQREAFVLREWVGMSTTEIALSLGTTVSAVDALLNRARRELIRVVGGAEGAAGCSETRAGLADGILDRAARAHLVRCKSCRQVRRVMQPQLIAARAIVPPAAIAARLADSLPGFAASGSVAGAAGTAAAGGGGIAAVVAKMAAAPAAVKGVVAAFAAVAAVGGGVAAETRLTRSPADVGVGVGGAGLPANVRGPAATPPTEVVPSASIAPAGISRPEKHEKDHGKGADRSAKGSGDGAGKTTSDQSGHSGGGQSGSGESTGSNTSGGSNDGGTGSGSSSLRGDGSGGSGSGSGSSRGDGGGGSGDSGSRGSGSGSGSGSGNSGASGGERQKHGDGESSNTSWGGSATGDQSSSGSSDHHSDPSPAG
jgi:RNA polymerase sigma factor (sigma-70 family)